MSTDISQLSVFYQWGNNDMAIRRIKAHYAIEDGDILKITNKSNRMAHLMFAVLLATIVVLIGLSNVDWLLQILIVAIAALVGFCTGSSGIEREVPRADLVEIKRYNWPPRVTVILDDERAKMAKPPPQPPKKDKEED